MSSSLSASAYGSAPLLLNLEPRDGSWHLASTWCNLGLWLDPGCSYRDACRALARTLGEACVLSDQTCGYDPDAPKHGTRCAARFVLPSSP